MNIKLFSVALGVFAVASIGMAACSSDTDTGAGGSGATTSTGGSGGTTNTGGSTSTGGGSTGGGGGGACRSCAEYVTDAADQGTLEPTGDPLCDASVSIWTDLLTCGCTACIADCPAEACDGGQGTGGGAADACGACLTGTFTGACSTEFGACSNDAG